MSGKITINLNKSVNPKEEQKLNTLITDEILDQRRMQPKSLNATKRKTESNLFEHSKAAVQTDAVQTAAVPTDIAQNDQAIHRAKFKPVVKDVENQQKEKITPQELGMFRAIFETILHNFDSFLSKFTSSKAQESIKALAECCIALDKITANANFNKGTHKSSADKLVSDNLINVFEYATSDKFPKYQDLKDFTKKIVTINNNKVGLKPIFKNFGPLKVYVDSHNAVYVNLAGDKSMHKIKNGEVSDSLTTEIVKYVTSTDMTTYNKLSSQEQTVTINNNKVVLKPIKKYFGPLTVYLDVDNNVYVQRAGDLNIHQLLKKDSGIVDANALSQTLTTMLASTNTQSSQQQQDIATMLRTEINKQIGGKKSDDTQANTHDFNFIKNMSYNDMLVISITQQDRFNSNDPSKAPDYINNHDDRVVHNHIRDILAGAENKNVDSDIKYFLLSDVILPMFQMASAGSITKEDAAEILEKRLSELNYDNAAANSLKDFFRSIKSNQKRNNQSQKVSLFENLFNHYEIFSDAVDVNNVGSYIYEGCMNWEDDKEIAKTLVSQSSSRSDSHHAGQLKADIVFAALQTQSSEQFEAVLKRMIGVNTIPFSGKKTQQHAQNAFELILTARFTQQQAQNAFELIRTARFAMNNTTMHAELNKLFDSLISAS